MDPIARVVIVDDEVEQAAALSATLEEQGYETHAVPSAADGLEAPRSALSGSAQAFDVLVTGSLNPEQRRFVGEIRCAGVRLMHLTRELLQVAKPARGPRR
jgi:CheY-like chemotaxis protein